MSQFLTRLAHLVSAHVPRGMPDYAVAWFVVVIAWVVGSYVGQSKAARPLKWIAVVAGFYIGWRIMGG